MLWHSAIVGGPAGSAGPESAGLEDLRFFHDAGIVSIQQLSDLCFDLAYLWRMSPLQVMALPLDQFSEFLTQAHRIWPPSG